MAQLKQIFYEKQCSPIRKWQLQNTEVEGKQWEGKKTNTFFVIWSSVEAKVLSQSLFSLFWVQFCLRDINFTHRQIIPQLTLPQFIRWHAQVKLWDWKTRNGVVKMETKSY